MNLPFKQTLHYIPKSQHANELIFLFLYVNTCSHYSTPKSHQFYRNCRRPSVYTLVLYFYSSVAVDNKTYSKTDSPHTLKLLELNSICICSRNIFPLYLTYQGTICIVYYLYILEYSLKRDLPQLPRQGVHELLMFINEMQSTLKSNLMTQHGVHISFWN